MRDEREREGRDIHKNWRFPAANLGSSSHMNEVSSELSGDAYLTGEGVEDECILDVIHPMKGGPTHALTGTDGSWGVGEIHRRM